MELSTVKYIEKDEESIKNGVHGHIRRVAMSQFGEVVKYHHPEDTNKWEDGTEVDWEKYEEEGYNCMVQIPKFFAKFEKGTYNGIDNVRRWSISSNEEDDFEVHPAFNRKNGKLNYRYIGAFDSSLDEKGRLRSLPNKIPHVNSSINEFRAMAKMNYSPNWWLVDFDLVSAIQLLYITEYGQLTSRDKLGVGGKVETETGKSLTLGNGSSDDEEFHSEEFMSYRGIENFYTGPRMFIDGMYEERYSSITVVNDENEYTERKNRTSIGKIANGWCRDILYSDEYPHLFISSEGRGEKNKHFGAYNSMRDHASSFVDSVVLGNKSENYTSMFSLGYSSFSGEGTVSGRLQYLEYIDDEDDEGSSEVKEGEGE